MYYVIVVLIYLNLVFILPTDLRNYLPIFLLLFTNGYFGCVFALKQLEISDYIREKKGIKNSDRLAYFSNIYWGKYSETDETIKSLIEIVRSSFNSSIVCLLINVVLIILTMIL